ncbi:MAG: flavin-containing monooxygenase [Nocardioides sp.]|uniref:flavin-containing monooxygenase n=1 Tax=Nocardioides sp. TaxID=35761 RepID=UPI003F084DA0
MVTTPPEHVDVLIVGAGLSGVGAAARLAQSQPSRSYLVLEARDDLGGTWDLFRYPGVRSDSDMYTLGYRFKPWRGDRALADGPSILDYVRETAAEYGVDRHIRYRHRVTRAEWSSDTARWTVTVEVTPSADDPRGRTTQRTVTAAFLWATTGYYSYDEPYTPEFPGSERFTGTVIHPQHWPEGFDHTGKRVVVIGSGATAVTLVPALVESGAGHVTMLQRSPTYVLSMPRVDGIGVALRRRLPAGAAYAATRWKNILGQRALYAASRRWPGPVRQLIRKGNVELLPEGYDVDTHFNPRYDPWDQRLCLVPDGDLFKALGSGSADVVTDTIETFTETGIQLTSGEHLDADVVVTATGLTLLAFGGIELVVDDDKVELPDHVAYRGLMLSEVPNFAFTIGYTNASWTLKADLVAEYVCRLLDSLDERGATSVVPRAEAGLGTTPFMDFQAGYVLRALQSLPTQGDREPWLLEQNYLSNIRLIRRGSLDDGVLEFR